MKNREYCSFDADQEKYYSQHPEEIASYLEIVFEEYAKDGCTPALLSSLRMIARAQGISNLARKSGMTRNGIQKALSETGNPGLHNINNIFNAMGFNFAPVVREKTSELSHA